MTDHFCLSHGLDFLSNTNRIKTRQHIEGFDSQYQDVNGDFTTDVKTYNNSDRTLLTRTKNYINTTKSSNSYIGKIIRMKNGIRGYITDKKVFKYIASDSIFEAINKTCPYTIEDVDFESEKYLDVGHRLGTRPNFLVGKPMTKNTVCMPTGINMQITGHVDTDKLTQTWEGCHNNVGDFFDKQDDLTRSYDSNTVRRCAIRTADIGATAFYIGNDVSSNYTCFTSKSGLTTDHIKSNMEHGLVKRVSRIIHEATLPESTMVCSGIMNNGQIAVGNISTYTSENFGRSVTDAVLWENSGIENCDAVAGSKINVLEATYGANCNNQTSDNGVVWDVPDNNWLDIIKDRINEKNPVNVVKINKRRKNPNPAIGCNKHFDALYTCSATVDKKIIEIPGNSRYATFDCSDAANKCMGAVLTLFDDGNLTLSNGDNMLWQSETTTTGVPLEKHKALNSKFNTNTLRTGDILYPGEFIGSPSGKCILLCEKIGNKCLLSIVYYLWGCNAFEKNLSALDGVDGHITDISGFRATYSINDANNDTSLNGKVIYINRDMLRMKYPDKMLTLGNDYIDAGNYDQSGMTIQTLSNSDLDKCKTECSAINNCYGFIHYEKDKKCKLKEKNDLFPNNLKRILSDDAKMFIRKYNIDNSPSCNEVILEENQNISGATATKIPQGHDMNYDTKCGLGRAISENISRKRDAEMNVNSSTGEILKEYKTLSEQNNELDNVLETTYSEIENHLNEYDILNNKNKSLINNDNINAMVSESNIENIRQNLNYMTWTAVATIAIFAIIKSTR